MELAGLPVDEREMILDLIGKLRQKLLTPEKVRELDEQEEFPEKIVRELLGPNIGLQLIFIPEEYDGMGGGARDIASVSEAMAKICLGISTAFLAIHLGTDPILVGGTEVQKKKWLSRIAGEGLIVAYAVTEPEAGSNLANFKTRAEPVTDNQGTVTHYRLNGAKQFISNGGVADILTVLAQTPEGPSFFIVEKGTEGFKPGKAEVKHGIRCASTYPLTFDNVLIPIENLIGGTPGKGLQQANEVFGYTRLMVAAFGLGAGVSALEKVIDYSKQRIQFGGPLKDKQGYMHKLVLPHVIRLETARAYIEHIAERLDAGEKDLQIEGAVAKLLATEAANDCADDAIQALGGYGYIVEYDVEKIKRDVKITTIYEGTSEIMQMIISTFRWRNTARSKGALYRDLADEIQALHAEAPDIHADLTADVIRALNDVVLLVHTAKLSRQQGIMFDLADLMAHCEASAALVRKTARMAGLTTRQSEKLRLISRLNACQLVEAAATILPRIVFETGQSEHEQIATVIPTISRLMSAAYAGRLTDLDALNQCL